MRQIFCLQLQDHQVNHFFLAPEYATQESFQELCKNLLKEATELSCEKFKGWSFEGNEKATYIGWSNLIEIIAEHLLPQYGYERIKLPTVCFFGPGIIYDHGAGNPNGLLPPESVKKIIEHNNMVNKIQYRLLD